MYQIIFRNFLINDIDSTKRHIKAGDYFGTLATILDLMRQTADTAVGRPTSNQSVVERSEQMKELKDDLIFLQENYRIIKKTKR